MSGIRKQRDNEFSSDLNSLENPELEAYAASESLYGPVTDNSLDDPDDTIAEAREIGNGTINDSLSDSTDVDMYKFTVKAGDRVTFTTGSVGGSEVDTYIRLFNEAGTQLRYNDDISSTNKFSSLNYYFSTAGTYYLGVTSYGNRNFDPITGTDSGSGTTGNYSLTVSGISDDFADDPDDTIAEAREIGNETIDDGLTESTDVDMYKVTVRAGDRVTFTTAARDGNTVDTFIRLFDGTGRQLAYNDDISYADGNTYSALTYTFNTAGTYFLGVASYRNRNFDPVNGDNDISGATGNYSLTVSGISGALVDDPDDTIAEAREIGNETIDDGLTESTDVDMYKITVRAGNRVTFTTAARDGNTVDTYIRLFDETGRQLAYNDDISYSAGNTYSSLTYTFNTAGTYFLGVTSYRNRNFDPLDGDSDISGATGNYSLTVSGLPGPAVDDPDDTIAEAREIGNETIDDGLTETTDVDMYKFTVQAGNYVTFTTSARDGNTVDTYIRLFDETGRQLAYNDDISYSTGNAYSSLSYTFNTAGTYFLGVASYGNRNFDPITGDNDIDGTTGNYSLTVSGIGILIPTDDPDDTIAEAREIGNGTVDDGLTETTDVDMYKFIVQRGDRVTFTTSARDALTVDTYIRLFDETGRQLAYNDDISYSTGNAYSSLSYTFNTAGTYYLGVTSYRNRRFDPVDGDSDTEGTTGNYSLTVSGITSVISVDDPDDTIAEAREIGNETIDDGLTWTTDVDMYKVTVRSGDRVTFTTSARDINTVDTYIRLFDETGRQLAYNDDISFSSGNIYSSLTYNFSNAGTYYLGVASYRNRRFDPISGDNDIEGATGNYSLTVSGISDPENTDLLSTAVALGLLEHSITLSASSSVSSSDDINMFSFQINAPDKVYFDLDRSVSSSLDSYLRIFDANGNQLAANDNGSAPGESATQDSYLEYSFAEAGTYYIGISSYLNSSYDVLTGSGITAGSSYGAYSISLGIIEPEDPDDQISEAVTLTAGTPVSAGITPGADVDMYKIQVGEKQKIGFEVTLSGLTDSYLRLFDANGNQLAFNDDGSADGTASLGSYLEYFFGEAGTYYVGVSAAVNTAYDPVTGEGDVYSSYTGNYRLAATVLRTVTDDDYEENDSRAEAADLGVFSDSDKISGLKMCDQADWYKFTLSADTGSTGSIEVQFNHEEADLDIVLYDGAGSRIAYSSLDSDTESVSLANLAAGEYFLEVSPNGSSEELDCTYSISYTVSEKPAPAEVGTNYVVLFSGGYNASSNYNRYYDNIKGMYEVLVQFGIPKENIYVLFADGTNSALDQCDLASLKYVNSDLSYADGSTVLSATDSNLTSVFNTLSTTVTANDHFMFYSFDHGHSNGTAEDPIPPQYLVGWGTMFLDTYVASLARKIEAKYSTYIMAQCYSGGIIEDMDTADNIYLCSASNPYETSGYDGFAEAIRMGLASGINNTVQLFDYAVSHDIYVTGGDFEIIYGGSPYSIHADPNEEHPQSIGGSFSIFCNLPNTNSITVDNNSYANGEPTAISVTAPIEENKAPVVSALSIVNGYNEETSQAHAGETLVILATAADPEGDPINKVSYYLIDAEDKATLLAVTAAKEDFLWKVTDKFEPGEYRIAACAEDSYQNTGSLYETAFTLKAANTLPEVTDVTFSAVSGGIGDTIVVTGKAVDAEGDTIDHISVYLDSDDNVFFAYPEEYLGMAFVEKDGTWSFTFTVDKSMPAGTHQMSFTAQDEHWAEGKALLADFTVTGSAVPENPEGSAAGVSWTIQGDSSFVVEYSTDQFVHAAALSTSSTELDTWGLTEGTYQWRVRTADSDQWVRGEDIAAGAATEPLLLQSDADGNTDVFFAGKSGTWTSGYQAEHTGTGDGWATGERVGLSGKNRLCDIFAGSDDASVLVMTDDSNGDALFVDDVYTTLPGTVKEHQARIAQINEIRAGAGDDIVDLTSQRFQYQGGGMTIRGGAGNDTIWANRGDNFLFGDAGADRLVGASGNDVIVGGSGNDSMHGGGGKDLFAFGGSFGNDTVEQLAGGSVMLWFESGNLKNWNADSLTYSDGTNSVTVSGVTADDVTLQFGDGGDAAMFAVLQSAGAFADFSSEKIFEETKGLLA